MLKTKLLRYLRNKPQQKILILSLLGLTFYLLEHRLTNLFGGLNSYDKRALQSLNSFNPLNSNILDILYFSVAKVMAFITSDSTALKLTSALFGLLSLLNIRFVLKHWFESKIANLSIVVVASSFWFLILARAGHPIVMPTFWLSAIFALYVLSQFTTKQRMVKTALITTVALSLYTPLMIWPILMLAGIFLFNNRPQKILKNINLKLLGLWLLLVTPLIYSLWSSNTSIQSLIGVTNTLPSGPVDYIQRILTNFGHLIFRGPEDPALNIGNLALLDVFQLAFLALGITTIFKSNDKIKFGALILFPVVLIVILSLSVESTLVLTLLLPVVFIHILVGFLEFISLWLKAFPKNPVGRLAGVVVCSMLIALSGYYNIHKYFTVWPNNPSAIEAHKQS